ncbi:SgcJ/EcaC family oxidoreductase [Streptomyces sp. Z26]|uniref:SgcJ/EcaC family oxidoreductase n=1 Tax=Streptomyces TaxID=1883 RepID=UPI000EF14C58|nr:SgcJ/EcaC family oxidoreductase [Streptomyces sp. Z26]RLL65751.1 SgcJ/EcaC family oxidoreductase [Streptomyces sp. Z26]
MSLSDDKEIRALWDAMAHAWESGDAEAFAAVFESDCDFTTVRGEKPPGRAGVAAGHAHLFRTAFRGTRLSVRVRAVRALTPELATVDVESDVVGADGTALVTTHALAVARKGTDGAWLIAAFHNMVPAPRPPDAPDPSGE